MPQLTEETQELVHPDVSYVYKTTVEIDGEEVDACEVEPNGWILHIKQVLNDAYFCMHQQQVCDMVDELMNIHSIQFTTWREHECSKLHEAELSGDEAKAFALDAKIDAWEAQNLEVNAMWHGAKAFALDAEIDA
jgi:hypothetical protein